MTRQENLFRLALVGAVCAAMVTVPRISFAQHQPGADLTHVQPPVANADVDFGVAPPANGVPIPGTGCNTGGIGGPTDPCAYINHRLVPDEVTVFKGGEVTYRIRGGGHSIAIYEVSKDTTREDIGEDLCVGTDPNTIDNPTLHTCNIRLPDGTPEDGGFLNPAGDANDHAAHSISDGKGDVVIAAAVNATNVHPDNRVWSVPGRLQSAGGNAVLTGGTNQQGSTAPTPGQLHTFRFLKPGRYLVICMNRTHLLNDWMFGFVNVVGSEGDGH